MRSLRLTVALGDYDINRPIIDGHVQPDGIETIPLVLSSPQRHWRMLRHREFDICELSLGSYVAMVSRADASLAGLPVFPHRRFRHSYIFVTGTREITSATHLAGGRVGVRNWQTTAGIYMRGILSEHHHLPLESVTWVAQDPEDVDLTLSPTVRLQQVADGRPVTDMCASGELDGLLYPEIPAQVRAGTGEIRRLFDDPRAEEERYFRRTGIFPIMHLVVVRRELVERHPWLARSIVDAFAESKRVALRRLGDPRVVSLAWLRWLIEHEREVLGPDAWAYGLGAQNRQVLETFLRYALAQGVAARETTVDELFVGSVLDDPPTYV